MPYAIIRGRNGRRHEVDFGDAAVRVEIHSSVEIFIEADSEPTRRNVGASPFLTFLATSIAKPPQRRRVVPRNPPLTDFGARSTIESKRSLWTAAHL